MKSKGGMGMLIGLGSQKGSSSDGASMDDESSDDEGSDMLAARALMKALKGSSASAVLDAFRELSAACKGYDDEAEEPSDDGE